MLDQQPAFTVVTPLVKKDGYRILNWRRLKRHPCSGGNLKKLSAMVCLRFASDVSNNMEEEQELIISTP